MRQMRLLAVVSIAMVVGAFIPAVAAMGSSLATMQCSEKQASEAAAAVAHARELALNAEEALSGAVTPPTFVEWFGSGEKQKVNEARERFAAIVRRIESGAVKVDCTCREEQQVAFVWATEPEVVHLCPGFWRSALRGLDSRGGTILAELTHAVGERPTKATVQGPDACRELARQKPDATLANAGNFEYFAESLD